MKRSNLLYECKELESIIENLAVGKEICNISDERFSLEEIIDFLREYLQELKILNSKIIENGNTPELLKEVFSKYSELWLLQVYCTIDSLPRVIGGLWRYPDCDD